MGTRADFYIGRGEQAEWLGSIAYDGYPSGVPKLLNDVKDLEDYKRMVRKILDRNDATKSDDGWPWPWKDSRTTDYAYAFDDGQVLYSYFGRAWHPFVLEEDEEEGHTADKSDAKVAVFPNMEDRMNVATPGSKRSGILAIGILKP